MCHQPALTALDAASDADLLDRLTMLEREIRHRQAHLARTMALLVTRAKQQEPHFGEDCAISEIAEALTLHPDIAHEQIDQALTLLTRHPAALQAWQDGLITALQAEALVKSTDRLGGDLAKARAVEAKVLPLMPRQVLQTTRRALNRAVLTVDADGARRRKELAATERQVTLRPEQDEMATVALTATAEQATAVFERIDQAARAQDPQDGRTLAQRRADAMCALVLGGEVPAQRPTAPAALVQVTVSLETLLGLSQEPGELERYGAIAGRTARELACAPGTLWRWLAYDPGTGALVKTSPRVYKPTQQVRRFVLARDRVCGFVGCTRPARYCDLDHVAAFDHEHPEDGGATVSENLLPLCRRHHRIKTAGGFTSRVTAAGRSVEWTSRRTGRKYQVQHAHDYRPEPATTTAALEELSTLLEWHKAKPHWRTGVS